MSNTNTTGDFIADLGACPECHSPWGYEYDGKRYSHVVGIIENDRCVRWHCPACATEWLRGALVGDAPVTRSAAASGETPTMSPSEAIAIGLCPSCIGTGRVDRCVPYEDVFPCSTCSGSGTYPPGGSNFIRLKVLVLLRTLIGYPNPVSGEVMPGGEG